MLLHSGCNHYLKIIANVVGSMTFIGFPTLNSVLKYVVSFSHSGLIVSLMLTVACFHPLHNFMWRLKNFDSSRKYLDL